MSAPSISLWDDTAQEANYDNPLDGDEQTELAVIGGGFTGLSTALHAALAGHDCHVLEAKQIGYGGSGRNVGLVNAGLWLPPEDVISELGEDKGAKLIALLGEGPSYVFSLIEDYQIRCEATRCGTIHAAHSPRGYQDLARRAEQWLELGADVELLSREAAGEKIGSDAFHGGLLDRRAGTINPMGYARGLARAALSAGAKISTGTRVDHVSRENGSWNLRTQRGTVTARYVVIGTNAYSGDLWPGLEASFTPIHFFQTSTEPLGERASHILKDGEGLWDTGAIMFSLRRDAFGRLAVGSMGKVIGRDASLSKRWASRALRRLFPDLGPVAFDHAWHGRIAMTPDHVPRIHELAPGLYSPIGYNGRGIVPGTLFGKAIAGLLSGDRAEDLPLPVTKLRPVPGRVIKSKLYQAAFTANQIVKSL